VAAVAAGDSQQVSELHARVIAVQIASTMLNQQRQWLFVVTYI